MSSGIPISLRILQFVMIYRVKGFNIVNEAEVDVFLEFSCFLYGLTNVGNLIFAFSKPSMYIWKFSVHMVLKPSLKDFEHNLASMWNESNYMVVWTFFGIALLWEWNESWPFPVSWPLLSFPKWKKVLLSHVQLFVTTCTVPTRLLRPWDFPGKSTGVGCHCLLTLA